MAYLITCAGSKTKPVISIASNLESLSFDDTLKNSRIKLLKLTNIHLDWERTLPAWQLYTGKRSRLYSQLCKENWEKECVDIRILSALFGWVKHTDLLPCYNLKMSDIIPETNERVYQFWHNQNLLNQFVNPNDIDLLSHNYRRAINGNIEPVANSPHIHFIDNYGTHKGHWLNEQLNKIQCSE